MRIHTWQLLIHLLHLGGLISSPFHFLQWRQVVIISESLVVIINAQAKLDPAGLGGGSGKNLRLVMM